MDEELIKAKLTGLDHPMLFKTVMLSSEPHQRSFALPDAMYVGAMWGDNQILISTKPSSDGSIMIMSGRELRIMPRSSNVVQVYGGGAIEREIHPPEPIDIYQERIRRLERTIASIVNAKSKAEAYRRVDKLREAAK